MKNLILTAFLGSSQKLPKQPQPATTHTLQTPDSHTPDSRLTPHQGTKHKHGNPRNYLHLPDLSRKPPENDLHDFA